MVGGAHSRRAAALAAMTAAVVLGGPAAADAKERFLARMQLTSHRPNTPTGGSLHIVWPSNGPGGKPKPEAIGIFQLPPGTRVNEKAVPECAASDTELQIQGDSACPEATFLGPGQASVISGLGPPVDPFWLEDRWYHANHAIVAPFKARGTAGPVLKVNRVEIRGSTFIARLSLPPGYPPGTKTAPKQTDQIIFKRVTRYGSFLTTPKKCPKSGRWVARATSIYDDGSSDTATSVTTCKRPKPARKRRRHHHREAEAD